ncbi:Protein of unknown function [Leuconostoc citreum]|nr:Protein of unknown function [Leuconostoc citreum]
MLLTEISDNLPNVIREIENKPINNPNSFIIESIRNLFYALKTRLNIDSASSAVKDIIEDFDRMADFNKNSK